MGFVVLEVELMVIWKVIREMALEDLRVTLGVVYKPLISRR